MSSVALNTAIKIFKTAIKTPNNILEGIDPTPLLDEEHKSKIEEYNKSFDELCSNIESKIENLNKIIEQANSLADYSSDKNSFLFNDEINIKLDEKHSELNDLSSKIIKSSESVSTDFYQMIEMSKKSNAYYQVKKKEEIGNQWDQLCNNINGVNLSIDEFYNYYVEIKKHNVQPDLLSSQMSQFNGNEAISFDQTMKANLLPHQYASLATPHLNNY